MDPKDETTPNGVEDKKNSPSSPETFEAETDHQVTFEEFLELAGTNGIWNYVLLILVYLAGIPSAFTFVSYQFVGATPDYWCHVQELLDANWTDQQIVDLAIPRTADGKLDGCLQRDYNYSLAASLGYEAVKENLNLITNVVNGTVSCPKRDFNHTQYKSTLVTEFDLVCERRALYSTTSSITQLGMLFASLFVGYITNVFGKRRFVLTCFTLAIIFGGITPFSPSIGMFIMCKFFMALFDMSAYLSNYVLLLELSSKSQRSYVGPLSGLAWSIGQMLLPGVAYLVREWKYLQLALTAPYLYTLVYFWILPESPRWLILQGRYKEVINLLKKIARWNKRTLPSDDKLNKMLHHLNLKTDDSDQAEANLRFWQRGINQLKDLFQTKKKTIQTFILFFCWFVTAFVYYGVSLNGTNIGSSEYWYMFFGGLVEIPSTILLWPLVLYVGRRISLIGSFFLAALSLLGSLGVQANSSWATVLSLAGKFAISSAFTLVYLLAAELNTTKARTLAVGISSVVARFGSISSPYVNDLIGAKNPTATSTMFGVTAFVAGLLSIILPETRKATLPESRADIEKMSSGTEMTNEGSSQNHQVNGTSGV
ncbi:solute carrier family 22 member 3-like [Oratosquilla oratoria]|uniref:solute carrier family 22 member 3-like n=1 Tax=Oratosquilla oratoria TaxID=337810 RepID=UPI003F758A5F